MADTMEGKQPPDQPRPPLAHGEREILRRMRRIDDQGLGYYGAVASLGKAFYPDEKTISLSQTRSYLRRLQEKKYIFPIGATDKGTTVYLIADRKYASARVSQILNARRSGRIAWDTTPAKNLCDSKESLAPAIGPTIHRGIAIGLMIQRQYAAETWKRAVDIAIEAYGPKLERVSRSRVGAILGICRRLTEERRRADENKQAQTVAELQRAKPPTAPAPLDPEAERAIQALFSMAGRRTEPAAAPAGPVAPATVEASAGKTTAQAIEDLLALRGIDSRPETQRYYREHSKTLIRLIGEWPIQSIDAGRVLEYFTQVRKDDCEQKGKPLSGRTLQIEGQILRSALSHARRMGEPIAEPRDYWPKLRFRVESRKRYLRREDLPKLLDKLAVYQRTWVIWAVYTGARKSELARLDWADVDLGARSVRLRGAKLGNSDRLVPLHRRLLAWCNRQSVRRGPILRRWRNVNRDLAKACREAGLPELSPNDLRRTFASWLKQRGIDTPIVASLMGHTTSRQVDRVYGQLGEGQFRQAIDRL